MSVAVTTATAAVVPAGVSPVGSLVGAHDGIEGLDRSEREACLEIRAATVDLLPPGRESRSEPLSMFAVSATQVEVEDGDEPLHWLLPATEFPAEGEADDLRKCLAFDAITVCQVADLKVLARERPETPATEVLPEADIDLLHTLLEAQDHRYVTRLDPGQPQAIRELVLDIGRLVGFHP